MVFDYIHNHEVLVAGFSNSPNASLKELFGEDFNKARALGESVMLAALASNRKNSSLRGAKRRGNPARSIRSEATLDKEEEEERDARPRPTAKKSASLRSG
jgi:hypothetical protein